MDLVLTTYLAFLLCYLVADGSRSALRPWLLYAGCAALTLWATFRSLNFPDTGGYYYGFIFSTNTLRHFSFSDVPDGYAEKGFYLLASTIKTLWNEPRFYFGVVAAGSLFLVAKDLRRYSLFPLMGMTVYTARFFLARNMIQIRAGLAIPIVIYALQYIERKELKKFLLVIAFAQTLHRSALLALPMYWLYNNVVWTKRRILIAVSAAFLTANLFSQSIVARVTELTLRYGIGTTYTNEDSGYTVGKGLANPMIYFQTFVLLLFTLNERRLRRTVPHYDLLRAAYLFSTLILITLSSFSTLSGRTSTIYATLEMCIIPTFVLIVPRRMRWVGYLLVGACALAIFTLNWKSASVNL